MTARIDRLMSKGNADHSRATRIRSALLQGDACFWMGRRALQ